MGTAAAARTRPNVRVCPGHLPDTGLRSNWRFSIPTWMENEMPKPSTILTELSTALNELAAGAQPFLASVRTRRGDEMSGVLWTPNAVVVSEQALPDAEEFEVSLADGSTT